MFLRQKCPSCKTEAEFVDVQVGHSLCCKKCNYEFRLEKQKLPILPYAIFFGGIAIAALVLFFVIKSFHDWWIYR